MIRVFIDGSSGTTGLRIFERLGGRDDITLIRLEESLRHDPAARADAIARADAAFLCLPDDAARESAALAADADTVIIDTSTAHRTAEGWTYGFAELTGQREKIAASRRIANPGCHASGFISLVAPLTENGLISRGERLTCFSLTGYSGGGKKMIADYENSGRAEALAAPRMYGLGQTHKHLPEMAKICGLERLPVFSPIVSSFYAGMEVVVPLDASQIKGTAEDVAELYCRYYTGKLVRCDAADDGDGFLSAGVFAGRDDMTVGVFGNGERITLVSRFDNLGKGASGAAIQNMNIALGLPEEYGLNLG